MFWKKKASKINLSAFADFIPVNKRREIEEKSGQSFPPLQKEKLRYILMQVRDDTPDDLQRHLNQALQTVVSSGGVVESIMSSLVLVIFKPAHDPQDRPVDALLHHLGPNVKAIFGQGEYLRGFIGTSIAFNYSTVLSKFGRMIEALHQLEFGSSKEISHSDS